jgi:hypothetical protein
MESLFEETVGVQKHRPTKITNQQRDKLYIELAQEIIDNNYSSSDINVISEDLKNLFTTDSGFEKAKALENNGNGTYRFNGDFVDSLDNIDYEIYTVLQENVKLWAKAHDVKPRFTKGLKLFIKETLNREKIKGETVYINGIQEDTATYLIDKDPNRNGGTVFAFEKIEANCEILND